MSETMKTRMAAMALLVAAIAIRLDTASEGHHATSAGGAALFTLHHAAKEPGVAPSRVVRTACAVVAADDVRVMGLTETVWYVGVTQRGDWASRGCRGPDPPHSDGTRTGCW